jgi:hypothetical protein
MSIGRPFSLDAHGWASTPAHTAQQATLLSAQKLKKSFSSSSRIAIVPASILEPILCACITMACSTATALQRPHRRGRNAARVLHRA